MVPCGMDLSQLQQQLSQPNLAPVESWDPPFCGDLPLLITADGQWLYQDSPIQRPALVRLFASVLLKQDNDYFLQTPAEKVRIQVADVPFLVTQSHWQQAVSGPELWLTTNIEDAVPLSAAYPLQIQYYAGQQLPYLLLWRGLSARLHRNLYYQLLQEAKMVTQGKHTRWLINSGGVDFVLAELANSDELSG